MGWFKKKKVQTKALSNKGKRMAIMHAGSENRFVSNCMLVSAKSIVDSPLGYHQVTDAQLFEN